LARGGIGLALAALSVGMLTLSGCFWRSPRAYQTELDRLERERRQSEEQAQLARNEAQRYSAVVYFAEGSAEIDATGARELAWFTERMRSHPEAVIEVDGFAELGGPAAETTELSDARARAVGRWLVANGIDESHLVVGGLSSQLSAPLDATPRGRLSNRRVEVTVH
jgi:OOP family OmpA-OmpF porin